MGDTCFMAPSEHSPAPVLKFKLLLESQQGLRETPPEVNPNLLYNRLMLIAANRDHLWRRAQSGGNVCQLLHVQDFDINQKFKKISRPVGNF